MKNNINMAGILRSAFTQASLMVILGGTVVAQVPAGHICPLSSGQSDEAQGTGACAGNNRQEFDLSYVFPGLTLYYNSTFTHDFLGFGRNITFSEISMVKLDSQAPYLIGSDASYIALEKRTWGAFNGSWIAQNRNLLSDYFTIPELDKVVRYSMDGATVKYQKVPWGTSLYRQVEIVSRAGVVSELAVGEDLSSEYLKFDQKRISIKRSGKNITLTNDQDPSRWVTLIRDSLSRLVRIKFPDGTMYNLEYKGDSNRLIAYKLSASVGEEGKKFVYDSKGRLLNVISSDGTSIRFSRDPRKRVVKSEFPNGQIQEEAFDVNGNLVSSRVYLIGMPEKPLEEAVFSFDKTGKLLKLSVPSGADEIVIEPQYYVHVPSLPVGYKKFKNGKLIESLEQSRAVYTWLSALDTYKDGAGKVLSKVQYVYPESMPFLAKELSVLEGAGKGSKMSFSYQGKRTTVTDFNAQGVKTGSVVYEGQLPVQQANFLAPAPQQLREFGYNEEKRLTSEKLGGNEVAHYDYDSQGRQKYYRNSDGEETSTFYDQKGYVEREELKTPAGVTTTSYVRQFHPGADDKLQFLTVSIVYPKEQVETKTEFDIKGAVVRTWKNGILAWER